MTESDKPSPTLPDTVVVFADTVASLPPSILVLTLQLRHTEMKRSQSPNVAPCLQAHHRTQIHLSWSSESKVQRTREETLCEGVQEAGYRRYDTRWHLAGYIRSSCASQNSAAWGRLLLEPHGHGPI